MNPEYEVRTVLDLPIEELGLSERIVKLLHDAEMNVVGDLVRHDADQLSEVWGINDTYLMEIVDRLGDFGARLSPHGIPVTEEQKNGKEEDRTPLEYSLEDLNLSIRTYGCLKRAGLDTVEEILRHSGEQLLEVRNFNQKCLNELVETLGWLGLELPEYGMSVYPE